MLSSFSGMLSKLKENKLVQNLTDNYHRIKKQIKSKMEILQIAPNIYHISYPEQETLKQLKTHIANRQFQIWNISEYRYDFASQKAILENSENGEIHHLCFEYYSNLPLYELMIAINSIHYFTALSPGHRVYVHCQDNKMRSSVFLACYLYKFKVNNLGDISEAILYINQKLGVNIEVEQQKDGQNAHYNNFHAFFKNFINYVNNPQIINPQRLQLLKILINDAPLIKLPTNTLTTAIGIKELKVVVEIRCKEEVVLKETYDPSVFEGDSISIELRTKTVILSDDFLVIIKYAYQGKAYSMLRIQLNTNFIFEKFVRAHQQQIDLSSFCLVKKRKTIYVDFIFEENLQKSSLAKLSGVPRHETLKLPRSQQNRVSPKAQFQGECSKGKTQDSNEEHFFVHEEEDKYQVDQNQMNRKIEEMLKNLNQRKINEGNEDEDIEEKQAVLEAEAEGATKPSQESFNQKDKEPEEMEEDDADQQDLEEYLSKLQSQA